MAGLFAKKDQSTVSTKKLAMIWHTLDPVVQGYFEQLYGVVPAQVTLVLNGEELPRDGDHPTLQSWVDGTQKGEGGDAWDLMQLRPTVDQVKTDPERPEPRQAFTLSWTVMVDTDFPARKDRIDIHDSSGLVTQLELDAPETTKGASAHEAKLDGLPSGTYTVMVMVNTEGSETATPNDHGFVGVGGLTLYVGETRDSQLADDLPKFSEAVAWINNISTSTEPDKQVVDALRTAALRLAEMDQLGNQISGELRRVADRLEMREYLPLGDDPWSPYRDRLIGAAAMANPETGVAPFADTIVEIVDELLS